MDGRGLSVTLFVLVMTLSVRAQRAWLFGCGLALFPLGVALAGCWSLIFSKILSSQLGLTPHSTSYDMWKETPVPMYMEFYLFNWTNGYIFNSSTDKATLARTKPSFEQLGPYVFREHHVRVNMTWNNNATVTFRQIRTWKFVQERSNGTLSDNVTTINTIALGRARPCQSRTLRARPIARHHTRSPGRRPKPHPSANAITSWQLNSLPQQSPTHFWAAASDPEPTDPQTSPRGRVAVWSNTLLFCGLDCQRREIRAASYMARDKPMLRIFVSGILEGLGSVVVTKTSGQLLLEGYEDPILDTLKNFRSLLKNINIPFTKFGWFSERNNSASYDGLFNMYTGTDDLSKLGMMYSWNYEHQSHYYNESCGLVRGTTGEICAPVKDMATLDLFSSDICGSLTLKKVGELETMGITGSKFEADASIFDNGTLYPSQTCYTTGESVYSGVMNISTCKWGAPAFISYPHFYLADKSYLDAVEGLSPSSKDHSFYFAVEPEMGVPLQVRARMQINILLQPIPDITLLKNVPRVFIPCMWFSQNADLDQSLAPTVKNTLLAKWVGSATLLGLASLGVLFLFIGLIVTVRENWRAEDTDTLVNTDGTPPASGVKNVPQSDVSPLMSRQDSSLRSSDLRTEQRARDGTS
uniref:Protein croquemort n=1 Tax=Timema genevievae TaxID=629358 RepID=A0A7R9K8D3_TIMGE|nr:unnamed protein product [Timema genevievae]